MSEAKELADLIHQAIDAEKGSVAGVANLVSLGVVALAAVTHGIYGLALYVVRGLASALRYVVDLISEYIWRRKGWVWVPRERAEDNLPDHMLAKSAAWVVFVAVFCPLALIVSGNG